MSANQKKLKAASVDSLALGLLYMGLPKPARFSVKKLIFAGILRGICAKGRAAGAWRRESGKSQLCLGDGGGVGQIQ